MRSALSSALFLALCGAATAQVSSVGGRPANTRRAPTLSGRVVLSDGRVPDESIVVDLVCQGKSRSSVSADHKGYYEIPLTQRGSMTAPPLDGCELRTALLGYRSQTFDLTGRRVADEPVVPNIVLEPVGKAKGTTISATSDAAPSDARKAFAKARELLGRRPLLARQELQTAVTIYPQYAAAWLELGRIFESEGNRPDARRAYQQAVTADPNFVTPFERLMSMAIVDGRQEEVAHFSARILELDPNGFPEAYQSNAIANFNLGDLDAAEASATALIKRDTGHRFPKAERVLGAILAEKQEWGPAAEHLRRFLELQSTGQEADAARKLLAEVEQSARASK